MKDIEYGNHQENKLFPVIRREFGDDLKQTTGYATFDYEDGRTQVELKSRRCCMKRYPTTMVGMNKIREAHKSSRRSIFCFNFQDGLYYWDYNPEEYTKARGGRCDRGCDEIKDYAYIKTSYLKKII
jgi:hypothetical protein